MSMSSDLPKAIVRILSNPVYMIVLLGACFHVLISGYGTFLPKYLEMNFGLTAAKASILTGKSISIVNYVCYHYFPKEFYVLTDDCKQNDI